MCVRAPTRSILPRRRHHPQALTLAKKSACMFVCVRAGSNANNKVLPVCVSSLLSMSMSVSVSVSVSVLCLCLSLSLCLVSVSVCVCVRLRVKEESECEHHCVGLVLPPVKWEGVPLAIALSCAQLAT